MQYLLVFIGGGLGSLIRFSFSIICQKINLNLPIATFLSNLVSCCIFGTFIYLFKEKNLIPEQYRHFVLIGICGGLSTFSTFSFETFELIKQGMITWALINIIINCFVCIALFFALSK